MRLDLLLIRKYPALSRRKARDVIEKGQVSVGGELVREAGRDLPESAAVTFDPNRKALPKARSTLPVLYQDEHVIVIDKPAGLLSVPAAPGARRGRHGARPRAGLRPTPEAARRLRRAGAPPRPRHVGCLGVRALARGARRPDPDVPRPPDRAALPGDRGRPAEDRQRHDRRAGARGVGVGTTRRRRSRAKPPSRPARTGACASACEAPRSLELHARDRPPAPGARPPRPPGPADPRRPGLRTARARPAARASPDAPRRAPRLRPSRHRCPGRGRRARSRRTSSACSPPFAARLLEEKAMRRAQVATTAFIATLALAAAPFAAADEPAEAAADGRGPLGVGGVVGLGRAPRGSRADPSASPRSGRRPGRRGPRAAPTSRVPGTSTDGVRAPSWIGASKTTATWAPRGMSSPTLRRQP